MKRILSLILCLVLAVSLLPLSAAAAGTPTVRVSSAQAKAGETITLDVAVENNPGIFALTFSFKYDTSRLKLIAVTPNKQSFPGSWQAASLKGATWASNAGDITANGTILTMTFEVLEDAAAGDANVEVVLGEIINEDMDDIEFTSVPGVITINSGETPQPSGDPTVRVPSAQARVGETVTLDVAVENNPGIFALTFSFQYDTSRLKLTAVTPNKQSFPGSWQAASLKGATWASNAGDIAANDTILTMTFEVLEDATAGDANVEVVLGEIINEDMDDIEFTSVPGVITVVKEDPNKEPVELYGASVSLKGNIGLNFYLIPNEKVLADAEAYVTLNGNKYPIKDAGTRVIDGKTLYQFSIDLHAKQMNDKVELKVFSGDGESQPIHRTVENATSTAYQFSVQDYIQKTIVAGGNDNLTALVQAMSDYGSLAQEYFMYNTANRADVQANLGAVTPADLVGYASQITEGSATGVTYIGSTLVLESETVLRFYFTVDSGDASDYTFKLNGKAVNAQKNDKGWYVEVTNIAAKNLDKVNTLVISGAEGTIVTVKACALSYVYAVLNGASDDAKLINVVKGLYLYNKAADAYFG